MLRLNCLFTFGAVGSMLKIKKRAAQTKRAAMARVLAERTHPAGT